MRKALCKQGNKKICVFYGFFLSFYYFCKHFSFGFVTNMKKLYLNPSLKEEEMKQRYRICSASQTLGITISGYSNKGGEFTPAADEPQQNKLFNYDWPARSLGSAGGGFMESRNDLIGDE